MKTETFVLGVLGTPFGLKGHLKFHSWSGETAHILKLKEAALRRPAGTGDPERRLRIEEASLSGANILLKFAGVDSPEAARAFSGMELVAGRDGAAALAEGEWYVEDLCGLELVALPEGGPADSGDPRLEALGTLTGVVEGGGGQLLELRLAGSGETRLLPFRDEFVGEISLETGRVVLIARWALE